MRASTGVSASAMQNLGCKASQSAMWDSLQRIAEDGDEYPTAASIREALLRAGAEHGYAKSPAFAKYVDAFAANYELTIEGVRQKFAPQDRTAWRRTLAEMEVGIRITDAHAQLSDAIASSLEKLSAAEDAVNATCPKPEDPVPVVVTPPAPPEPAQQASPANYANVWQQLKATVPLEVYGARRILATAYQSCDVLALPPMTANTPNVAGVTRDAQPNSSNGGILRHYGSLADIDSTHYYIHNQNLAKASCQEVRNHPPIYDFGGKPYTSSSLPTTLNMLRGDGGSGSEVFGTDCSGFVFSALAAAGLRMIDPDPKKPLKASLVLGTPAAAFKEPQNNHLTCLAKIDVTKDKSIASGDVVATTGHIIMLESVGADPFALNKIKSAADCGSVSYKNFDFVIAQSSPSKVAIGINRYRAKDYLAESGTMRIGLERYAAAACRAKFGQATALSSPDLSVVRHKRTPECLIPEFELTGGECVDSCRPL